MITDVRDIKEGDVIRADTDISALYLSDPLKSLSNKLYNIKKGDCCFVLNVFEKKSRFLVGRQEIYFTVLYKNKIFKLFVAEYNPHVQIPKDIKDMRYSSVRFTKVL